MAAEDWIDVGCEPDYDGFSHRGVIHETEKAKLFRVSPGTGIWLPKKLVTHETNTYVEFYDVITIKEIETYKVIL